MNSAATVVTEGSAHQEKRLTRSLRVELLKPLDGLTWDQVGPVLRAQRSVAHRLYNAGVFACVEYANRARRGEPVGIFRVSTKNPETRAGIPNVATGAYRVICEEYEEIQKWAQAKLEGKPGDQRSTLSVLAGDPLTGATLSCIGQQSHQAYGRWAKAKGSARLPSAKIGMPIPVHKEQAALAIDDAGKVSLTLVHAPGLRVRWALAAGKGSQWGRLRALAVREDGRKSGEVRVKYDEAERKWFAFISYSEPAPVAPRGCDPDHVMVLHRGQRNLLVAMTNRGRWMVIAKGDKIREFKRKMAARRLSERQIKDGERGDGARGHGSKRRFQTRDGLENRERDWIKTELQRLGARLAHLCVEWGVGVVLIEDYGGIGPSDDRNERRFLGRFPNYQLKQCLGWSLTKIGLKLAEYPSEFISQTCPRCGNQDAAQQRYNTGVFHCAAQACGFGHGVDFVACLHALRRACGGDAGEWEKRLKADDELAAAIRQRKETSKT